MDRRRTRKRTANRARFASGKREPVHHSPAPRPRVPPPAPWRSIPHIPPPRISAPRRTPPAASELECRREQRRSVDVSVAVHLAEAQELGAFQARNQAQHALLLSETHVILEPHQVVASGARILLAKLHHRV